MADFSVHQFLSLINQQVSFQETLNDDLSKLESLANLAMSDDFLKCSEVVVYYSCGLLETLLKGQNVLTRNRLTFC